VAVEVSKVVRTLRLKVKREGYAWLNAAAIEVNQVWDFANQTAFRAVDSPCPRPYKWLSAFDLDKITAGACKYFEHIGSDTIQRVNAEYAIRRNQIKKRKLRWRVSDGPKRSLGWIPFKAVQLKRKGTSLRFSGKTLRVFQRDDARHGSAR
jgi:putative transposase